MRTADKEMRGWGGGGGGGEWEWKMMEIENGREEERERGGGRDGSKWEAREGFDWLRSGQVGGEITNSWKSPRLYSRRKPF